MQGSYTQPFLVRFDECGHDGAARGSAILRYVAETAFAHSAAVGYPLSWYFAHELFWVVRQARIHLQVAVGHATTLEVTTQVVGARRTWARRVNAIRDAAGVPVGTVAMDWILTDSKGRPTRIPPSMEAEFSVLPGEPQRLREDVATPPAEALEGRHTVRVHESDPRGHMNNAAYLELFEDALAALGIDPQARPVDYDLEYLRPVRSGDIVRYAAWATGSAAHLVARLPDGPVVWRGHRSQRGSNGL